MPEAENAQLAAPGLESECSVRPLSPSDVAAVAALAAGVREAARWSPQDYERAARGEFDVWVAVRGNELIGFVVARFAADEMEILNLAVASGQRRRGVASRLLSTALESGRTRGVTRVFLEVRKSNGGATAFYLRRGFVPAGRRPRYYADPPEDAEVLSLQLGERST